MLYIASYFSPPIAAIRVAVSHFPEKPRILISRDSTRNFVTLPNPDVLATCIELPGKPASEMIFCRKENREAMVDELYMVGQKLTPFLEYTELEIFRENTEDLYMGIEWKYDSPEAIMLRKFLSDNFSVNLTDDTGIGQAHPPGQQGHLIGSPR